MKEATDQHHHQYSHLQQRLGPPLKRESLSDEVDSRSSSDEGKKLKLGQEKALVAAAAAAAAPGGGDGASIEVAKRPRGRPPGSKNKPKPPVVITREADPAAAMRPHILEIPAGHDVADSLARFARRRNVGVCVLAGTGAVANVVLRQPAPPAAAAGAAAAAATTVCFHGRFEILSMSATFLPPAMAALLPAPGAESLSIALAGPHGQVVGGAVAGPLVAAGAVVVVAAAFGSPTFHRLPAEDDVSVSVSVSGGGEAAAAAEGEKHVQQQQHHLHQPQPRTPEHRRQQAMAAATESCGMAIYSSHVPSEIIWATAARPPHPPPY